MYRKKEYAVMGMIVVAVIILKTIQFIWPPEWFMFPSIGLGVAAGYIIKSIADKHYPDEE